MQGRVVDIQTAANVKPLCEVLWQTGQLTQSNNGGAKMKQVGRYSTSGAGGIRRACYISRISGTCEEAEHLWTRSGKQSRPRKLCPWEWQVKL